MTTLRSLFFTLCMMAASAFAGVTTETIVYHSQALDRETTYIIVRPSEMPEGNRFPVLYLLHGATGSYSDWTDKTSVTQVMDGRDLLLVMPDGDAYGWYLDSQEKQSSQFDSAISRDLVADVDARFPTIANAKARGIAGLSMGGHGALSLALKHPELYQSASSMSGILDIAAHPGKWKLDDILGKQPENLDSWKANSVFYLADKLINSAPDSPIRSLAILFDTGISDKTGAVDDARKLDAKLNDNRIWHIYREFPGTHNWEYWDGHVKEHIDFHEKIFRQNGYSLGLKAPQQ